MDTISLPSGGFAAPNAIAHVQWSPAAFDASRYWRRDTEEGEVREPYYTADRHGIMRDPNGMPLVATGSVTPIARVDLDEEAPAVMAGPHIACGLAAAAWRQAGGGIEISDRDALICLIEDACQIPDCTLAETFCIAYHEIPPARERVAVRMATDLEFTQRLAQARAIMAAGCAFFPWYRGDGSIPN